MVSQSLFEPMMIATFEFCPCSRLLIQYFWGNGCYYRKSNVYNEATVSTCARSPIYCESCPTRIAGVFARLSRERLRALDRCKADNLYHKGQIIFQEGTPALGVHCVYEGQLKLYKSGTQGRPQIIGLAKPGTMVGHRAVLTDKVPHLHRRIVGRGPRVFCGSINLSVSNRRQSLHHGFVAQKIGERAG